MEWGRESRAVDGAREVGVILTVERLALVFDVEHFDYQLLARALILLMEPPTDWRWSSGCPPPPPF